MPDNKLLRLAREKRLHESDVIGGQVRHMLRDEKSSALVTNFSGQWLQFSNIDVVRPDVKRFSAFEDSLRHSMRRETERFIEDDRSR